jgi:hypothetical protein
MSFTYLFFPVIIWDSTYIYILLSVIRTFFPLISPGDIFKINKLNWHWYWNLSVSQIYFDVIDINNHVSRTRCDSVCSDLHTCRYSIFIDSRRIVACVFHILLSYQKIVQLLVWNTKQEFQFPTPKNLF